MSNETFLQNFVCFQLPPPSDLEQSAFRAALRENPRNVLHSIGTQVDTRPAAFKDGGRFGDLDDFDALSVSVSRLLADGHDPNELALNNSKLWANGKTLRIRFLEGSLTLQKKVRQQAETWLEHANIHYEWVKNSPANIRIAFKQGGGSWSYVGTVNDIVEDPRPTMNFGTLTDKSPADELSRVVLHEFGHALGCIHEHQSPLTSIKWNIERVYYDCARPPNNWSRAKTDVNIINRFKTSEVLARKFDPDSIMLYKYPAEWMLGSGSEGTKLNSELSAEDKAWVRRCYPVNKSDVGAFSTLQIREWDNPDTSNDFQFFPFSPAFDQAPQIAMGLTWLDLDCRKELSIEAVADKIAPNGFEARIESTPGSRIYTGACGWLESVDEPTQLQTGAVEIKPSPEEVSTLPAANFSMKSNVVFPTKFGGNSVKVVVWLSGLEMSNNHDWKIKVIARNVTPQGFTVQLEVGSNTVLRKAKVTWIAYPATRSDIASGVFEAGGGPARARLPSQNAGTVTFADDDFSDAPQDIVVGISGVDFGKDHNLRLRLTQKDTTAKGFVWHLDTWLDSDMYGATGQYLALTPLSPTSQS